jgi:hypothetical protein
MVNNSSNINKQKQSFSSDGRQFYQYQQLSSGLLILEEFSTITVQTFFWFVDIG